MKRWIVLVSVTVVALAACSSSSSEKKGDESKAEPQRVIVFNGEGNNLNVFDAQPPFEKQRVITTRENDPKGWDINAQICFFDDNTRMITGEDTNQPDPPAGWGIWDVAGDQVGDITAARVGRLTPTYQPNAEDQPENYGCGVLSDGRILTTDIGDQAAGSNGQLIIWFGPFDTGTDGTVGVVPYCKLDIGIATAGGIAVDADDNIYVASARGDGAGVWKYSGPFPTGPAPEDGCSGTDGTGAPMAENVTRDLFIKGFEHDLLTPNAVAIGPDGHFFVTSVLNGVINEYDRDGAFVRTVLKPSAGETLGEKSFSTGTPVGIGIGPDGTIYYADIGLVAPPGELPGPGDSGSVRRIVFEDGEPQPPEIMGTDLAFPDGIGVFVTGG